MTHVSTPASAFSPRCPGHSRPRASALPFHPSKLNSSSGTSWSLSLSMQTFLPLAFCSSLSLSPLHPEAFTCRSLSSHHWFGDQSLCLLMTLPMILLHVCILVSQGARQDGASCTPASCRASAAPDTREVPQKEPNSGGAIQWPSTWSSVNAAHVIHRMLRGHRRSRASLVCLRPVVEQLYRPSGPENTKLFSPNCFLWQQDKKHRSQTEERQCLTGTGSWLTSQGRGLQFIGHLLCASNVFNPLMLTFLPCVADRETEAWRASVRSQF